MEDFATENCKIDTILKLETLTLNSNFWKIILHLNSTIVQTIILFSSLQFAFKLVMNDVITGGGKIEIYKIKIYSYSKVNILEYCMEKAPNYVYSDLVLLSVRFEIQTKKF